MRFTPIDRERWDRRELFDCFHTTCMYVTVDLDVTALLAEVKARGLRFYPALIHCIAKVANGAEDYRYGYDEAGNVGLWDELSPLYTVPRRGAPHLFAMVSTRWCGDFPTFYARFLDDYARAENCGRLWCDDVRDACHIGVTAVPGLSFSGFSFGGTEGKADLTPFAVIGRYRRRDGQTLLPVAGEFSHAVNDGWHVTRFFERLGAAANELATCLRATPADAISGD